MSEFTVKPEDIEMTQEYIKQIDAAIHSAMNGSHVAIICRNSFDREEKAYHAFMRCNVPSVKLRRDTLLEFSGGGSIEFVRIESFVGRGIHDFDAVQLSSDRITGGVKEQAKRVSAYWVG